MKTVVVVPIRGTSNAWAVAQADDPPSSVQQCEVTLEIRGNPRDGFHLIMSPTGFFAADTWHDTVQEAKETAARAFGLPHDSWT